MSIHTAKAGVANKWIHENLYNKMGIAYIPHIMTKIRSVGLKCYFITYISAIDMYGVIKNLKNVLTTLSFHIFYSPALMLFSSAWSNAYHSTRRCGIKQFHNLNPREPQPSGMRKVITNSNHNAKYLSRWNIHKRAPHHRRARLKAPT